MGYKVVVLDAYTFDTMWTLHQYTLLLTFNGCWRLYFDRLCLLEYCNYSHIC